MFRSATLRLTALYTAGFALAVVGLGAVILLSMRARLTEMFDAGIRSEAVALSQEYRTEGLQAVIHAVRDRDETPGHLNYGLEGPGAQALAGRLAGRGLPVGWSQLKSGRERIRVLGVELPDGHRLLVGDDVARAAALDWTVLTAFAAALLGVVLLGTAAGYALSRSVQRRMSAISGAVEAIIDGDLGRRLPVRGDGDDLDRMAVSFNRMLDRISVLMESLRQVSSDVAHDLRTPLHRLRAHLEAGLQVDDAAARAEAIERAQGELDAILETFTALLRIAQVEGGERRAAFRPTDLGELAARVVEAFAPSAEEDGRALALGACCAAPIEGDPELLTQMLVNLVENALRHTPPGAQVRISVEREGEAAKLSVVDDGPGVPPQERAKVFDRFYRLEASRTTPGSGLGLALVAAVARLHGARVQLDDACPGLEASVRFPLAA